MDGGFVEMSVRTVQIMPSESKPSPTPNPSTYSDDK